MCKKNYSKTDMKRNDLQTAIHLSGKVEWLTPEERENYTAAVYAALKWGRKIEKETERLRKRQKKAG